MNDLEPKKSLSQELVYAKLLASITYYHQYFQSRHKLTGVLGHIFERQFNQLSSVEGFVMSDHRIIP